MKARVRLTGEIVEVKLHPNNSKNTMYMNTSNMNLYYEHELNFHDTLDYWEKLLHQYAGMAMQGLLSNERCWEESADKIAEVAICYAKELIKGLKLERSN